MKQYLSNHVIPIGLQIKLIPQFGLRESDIDDRWNKTLREASKELIKTVIEAYRKECYLLQKEIAKVNNVPRNMIPEQLHIATKLLEKHNEATNAKLYTKTQRKFRKHLNNTMNSSDSAHKTDSVNDLNASKSSTMDIPSNDHQTGTEELIQNIPYHKH